MATAPATVAPARRQDSIQWRIFYLTLGLGVATGLISALVVLNAYGMLNPPDYRLWALVAGIAAVAGFIHYLIFKFALRRQFQRLLDLFYPAIGETAPRLAPVWKSTEIDDIDALFVDLIGRLHRYIGQQAELERLQRYFSPAVADRIARQGSDAAHRVNLTVLFCDIRDFTGLAETLPPDELVELLNAYFTAVIEIIYEEEGTVLKLIGDGVMAVFGAPLAHNDDVERAARVARRLPAAFERVAAEWSRATGRPRPRGIGVGIATGEVVVGNIGSPKHLDYTVIGDTVNVASRLSGVAHAGQVLLTAQTADRLNGQHSLVRSLDPIPVKGKDQPVPIAELLASAVT